MSKKKTNKRLERLFAGVDQEQAKPLSSAGKGTGETKPSNLPVPARPRAAPPKPAPVSPEEAGALASMVSSSTGAMSLAFRTDESNWATLRVVDDSAPRSWAVEDQMLVKQVADQLSLALENARLFKDTQARAEELAILNEMGHDLTNALEVRGIYETIYKYTSRLMDTTDFFIAVYDRENNIITLPFAMFNGEPAEVPPRRLGEGLTDHILKTKKTIFLPDNVAAQMKTLGIDMILIGDQRPAQCWLGVPLLAGEEILGAIVVQSVSAPRLFNERQRDLLQAIGSQSAIALENARLFQLTESSERELRTLFTSMTDVILVLSKDGTYVRIAPTNPSRLFKTPTELLGKKIPDLLPAALSKSFMGTIHKALMSDGPVEFEYEMGIEDKSYWFDATVTKLDHDNVFWIGRDITERKIAEKALEKRNEYLAAAAEIGRLVTSTLDLNTIFTRTVNLVSERFGFYHAAIFVVEETGFSAVLREATGSAGSEMKRQEHSLPVNELSIVGKVAMMQRRNWRLPLSGRAKRLR